MHQVTLYEYLNGETLGKEFALRCTCGYEESGLTSIEVVSKGYEHAEANRPSSLMTVVKDNRRQNPAGF